MSANISGSPLHASIPNKYENSNTSSLLLLTPPITPPNGLSSSHLLIVSPYSSPPHLLNLSTVCPTNRLLAQALTILQPTTPSYATTPYLEAFNWPEVASTLRELVSSKPGLHWPRKEFFLVVFRSQIPPTTSRKHLGALDQASHAEAMASGGLLKYWFGTADDEGKNIATCRFNDMEDFGDCADLGNSRCLEE
jgi:hypothetical protein